MEPRPLSGGITREEWLKALSEVGQFAEDDQGAILISDVMAMCKIKRHTAERRMRMMVEAGKAIKTHKRAVAGDGRVRHMVAFRLVRGARLRRA